MGEEWKCTLVDLVYVYTREKNRISGEQVCDELNRMLDECIELRTAKAQLEEENAKLTKEVAWLMKVLQDIDNTGGHRT